MIVTSSLLLRQRPNVTTPVVGYTARIPTEISTIFVTNTTNQPANFSIYHDVNATTYDENTALYFEVPVAANTTFRIDSQTDGGGVSLMFDEAIAVQSSVANALTFSGYGSSAKITGDQNT
jgi:hypothetical protein